MIDHRRKNKEEPLFSNLYYDFAQCKHGYIRLVSEEIKCIYVGIATVYGLYGPCSVPDREKLLSSLL
jgi:hypothetical protein